MANKTTPMINVIFDNVIVNNPPADGTWGKNYYKVENVQGKATGKTWPIPPGFVDETDKN